MAEALAAAARLQPSSALDSLPPLLASVARKSGRKKCSRSGARAALAAALAAADASGAHPAAFPLARSSHHLPLAAAEGGASRSSASSPELTQALGLRLACRAWLSAGARRGAALGSSMRHSGRNTRVFGPRLNPGSRFCDGSVGDQSSGRKTCRPAKIPSRAPTISRKASPTVEAGRRGSNQNGRSSWPVSTRDRS